MLLCPRRGKRKTKWRQLLTLLVHLVVLGVRRVRRVVAVHLAVALRVDHPAGTTRRILARDLVLGGLVADRGQLGSDTAGVARRLAGLRGVSRSTALDLTGLSLSLGSRRTLTLFGGLALVLFLLLAGLPFLADFLELCRGVKRKDGQFDRDSQRRI